MTQAEIEALETMLAKAAPGPWDFNSPESGDGPSLVMDAGQQIVAVMSAGSNDSGEDDARFVVALRNAAPALLAAAKAEARLREAMAKVKAHTSYLPGAKIDLLAGLLASCDRIASAALGGGNA